MTSEKALNYRTGSGSDLAVAKLRLRLPLWLSLSQRPGRYRFLFCSCPHTKSISPTSPRHLLGSHRLARKECLHAPATRSLFVQTLPAEIGTTPSRHPVSRCHV